MLSRRCAAGRITMRHDPASSTIARATTCMSWCRSRDHRAFCLRMEEVRMKMFGKSLALAVLISSAAVPAQAQTLKDFLDAAVARWNTPTDPFHVIGNVYYVGTKGIASYLIVGPAGNILIDTRCRKQQGRSKRTLGSSASNS